MPKLIKKYNPTDGKEYAGQLATDEIADSAVINSKIADGAIDTVHFASDCKNPEYSTALGQALLAGGNNIYWNGSSLKFEYLSVIPIDRGFSSAGLYYITAPTSGTVVYYSNTGVTTLTCDANGIPIPDNCALFYELPEGATFTSLPANFYVVNRQNTTWRIQPNWILIAHHRSTSTGTAAGHLIFMGGRRSTIPDSPGGAITPHLIGAAELAETYLLASLKGAANGVAELGSDGIVKAAQLPATWLTVEHYTNYASFPTTGETDVLYVADDTNQRYMWDGSAYVNITGSLALGETSTTAYRGDRGKTAYDHSQLTTGNPHNLDADDIGAVDSSDVGAANGVASLDSTGKLPESQLSRHTPTEVEVAVASATWSYTHNRGAEVQFQALDASGQPWSNLNYAHSADLNTLYIYFGRAETGKIIIF